MNVYIYIHMTSLCAYPTLCAGHQLTKSCGPLFLCFSPCFRTPIEMLVQIDWLWRLSSGWKLVWRKNPYVWGFRKSRSPRKNIALNLETYAHCRKKATTNTIRCGPPDFEPRKNCHFWSPRTAQNLQKALEETEGLSDVGLSLQVAPRRCPQRTWP